MSDFINEACLADVVEFIVDNRGRTAPTEEHGIPLIATNCVSNEHLYPLKEKLRYVSQETYENWFRSHPIPGDILLTNKGSQNGAICLVPDPVDFCIAQDMVALRADQNKIYPLYLFAVLRSRLVQNRIKELNVDAVIPHFKKTDFNKLYFPLLGEREQKFIGDLYFKLSYKIELNHQINQTLESMAQAIFKSWFVDFEPVKAKISAIEAGEDAKGVTRAAMRAVSGKTDEELDQLQAEQPDNYTQLKTTAELFPAAMQDSELGEIPEGWDVKTIDSIAIKVAMGPFGSNIKVSTFVEKGVPIISGQHLHETLLTESTYNYITEEHAKKLANSCVSSGDLIFTHAGNIGQVSLIPSTTKYAKYVISQRQFYLRPDTEQITSSYLVYFFRSHAGQHLLLANASQVGVPSISRPSSYLKIIEIVVPAKSIRNKFETIIECLIKQIVHNREEIESLTTIRDVLLPKLLSGELSVDATGLAEEN